MTHGPASVKMPGSYVAAYPVFVVDDHPAQLRFSMQVDDLIGSSFARPRGRDRCRARARPDKRRLSDGA